VTPNPNPVGLWPKSVVATLALLAVLGAVAFLVGAAGQQPLRAWQIYLVNFLFWSGVAVAGVVLVAIWHLSSSVWGKVFQGLALAGAGFFPVVLALFLPLLIARETLFPWVRESPEHRAGWMNPAFVFARDGLGLLVLLLLAALVAYYRLRTVVGARWEEAQGRANAGNHWPSYLRDWRGHEAEAERSDRILSRLAPAFLIVYALVFSLLAFDLIQALDPHWYSTLFGAYIFFGNIYAGLAWVAVLSAILFRAGPERAALSPVYLHPMGKLLFGFCLFHGMLFYSQYLPIWYGNLPHEIEFVIVRTRESWWPWVSLLFLLTTLLLPFILLLRRPVKENPGPLAAVALLVLMGMWVDRFVLVVPSLWRQQEFPFGFLEVAVTLGFAALVLLCTWGFSRYFPLLHHDPARLPASHR
jgi:hypothetical protein